MTRSTTASAASPTSDVPVRGLGRLQWLALSYERVQKQRIAVGEQVRALYQGRDRTWGDVEQMASPQINRVLRSIGAGTHDGPSRVLGNAYRLYLLHERELRDELAAAVAVHPAWYWLENVRGVGPTLAARLLARLHIEKAPTPSSFWRYCGLDTVEVSVFVCDHCDARILVHQGESAPASHVTRALATSCAGLLQGGGTARVAARRFNGTRRPRYDAVAKKVCYLIGMSFLKCGGSYADEYWATRAQLEHARPTWSAGRIHMSSLRRTEKLFLRDLWVAWRS